MSDTKTVQLESWFHNAETKKRMDEMSDEEMKTALLSLVGSHQFIAILKYANGRMSMAQQGLFTLDPFKEQTQMARFQGVMTGILDLPDAVWQLAKASAEAEAENKA